MRNIFYNYSTIHYKLPSRDRFTKRLGEYDALAEFAVLSFLEMQTITDSLDEPIEYIKEKAKYHHVKINGRVSMVNHYEALYKSFMVNTYAMFSEFIDNIREDIRIIIDPNFIFVDDNNISDYQRLKRSLASIGITPDIPQWLEQIEDYYRLVRNHVAHSGIDNAICKNAFAKIDIDSMNKDYPVFKGLAPNLPGSITMDDFYLYSATVKHIANLITLSFKDRINWRNIGNTHPKLITPHCAGTDRRKLAKTVLNSFGIKNYSKEDLDAITDDIRSHW